MNVKKQELLSLVNEANKIYVITSISLFPSYIEVLKNVALEFIEHNFNENTSIDIEIRDENLYILEHKEEIRLKSVS